MCTVSFLLQITTSASDVVFPSALGRRLVKLRGLVFTRTKLAYWSLVLRATIHKTVQPAGTLLYLTLRRTCC